MTKANAMDKQTTDATKLKPKDFASDQAVRWCPGCGDYAILNAVRQVCSNLGLQRENTVFVSGIGCSSRFPYYMNTYGFHTIHGRAPAVATGIKVANPKLNTWIITGDGDGLSIGGNHLIHLMRRNLNVTVLLFNNQIYGLTKGQYSPTSAVGKKTKSTPRGSLDMPLSPLGLVLAAEASFVARGNAVDKRLVGILERAARHRGTSFVEIYQDCNIFNHGVWDHASDKKIRDDHSFYLEHGKPLIFGKNRDKGILGSNNLKPQVVQLGNGISEADLLVHDETDECMAYMLTRLTHPDFPEAFGVFYDVEDRCYEEQLEAQIASATAEKGVGDLKSLLYNKDSYVID
jgi:2-oxoglutarate ferredoxin oxidoreductase subunit beta